MLYYGYENFVGEDGLGAMSSLTGLVHLKLNSCEVHLSTESCRALSSLTAVSHLKLILSYFNDEVVNALACLTALTHLDLGDEYNVRDPMLIVSDEGARALA
jgi:hypothetical protein